MKVLAITQARMGSSRLPGKIMKEVNGKTLLKIHLDRINKSTLIDKVIVATTISEKDDELCNYLEANNISFFRGSENNVLERFYLAGKDYNPEYIIRLTSDCPLIDPKLIDKVVNEAISSNVDYCTNVLTETYPDGQDIEVVKFSALKNAFENAKLNSEREHVTPYIRNNSNLFSIKSLENDKNYGHIRITVDEDKDYELIKMVCSELGLNKTWQEYADFINENTKIKKINSTINRNEGYKKSLENE